MEREWLEELFNRTDNFAANKKSLLNKQQGKIVATIFYEPSTRTRFSFEAAIGHLGATNVSSEAAGAFSSAKKGESIEDTIQTMDGYVDAIVMRHGDDDSAHRAAKVSAVPIINAGSGSTHHPTQALLDMYTIQQLLGQIDGAKIAFGGDLVMGRTANTLAKAIASMYKGITMYGINPEGKGFDEDVINYIKKQGAWFREVEDFRQLPKDLDIIYQTRPQEERYTDGQAVPRVLAINNDVMTHFGDSTYIMHPLPRVEGERSEIHKEVDCDPRAKYFQQSNNGFLVRTTLIDQILER